MKLSKQTNQAGKQRANQRVTWFRNAQSYISKCSHTSKLLSELRCWMHQRNSNRVSKKKVNSTLGTFLKLGESFRLVTLPLQTKYRHTEVSCSLSNPPPTHPPTHPHTHTHTHTHTWCNKIMLVKVYYLAVIRLRALLKIFAANK